MDSGIFPRVGVGRILFIHGITSAASGRTLTERTVESAAFNFNEVFITLQL
jgi:hypothetical protein